MKFAPTAALTTPGSVDLDKSIEIAARQSLSSVVVDSGNGLAKQVALAKGFVSKIDDRVQLAREIAGTIKLGRNSTGQLQVSLRYHAQF